MVWIRINTHKTKYIQRLTIIMICILLSSFSSAVLANTPCEVASINGSASWVPISYYENNQLTGVAPQIITTILTEMGVKVELQPVTPWKRLLNHLITGELDILTGAYYTNARAEKYQYSDIITVDEIRIFVKKGKEFPFYDLSDLKGLVGVRPLGGSYGQSFDDYAAEHLTIHEHKSSERMMKMLAQNRVDYGIWGYYDGLGNIAEYNYQDQISALPTPVSTNNVHALFSKRSPCVSQMHRFNELLHQMHDNGEIDKIVEEYLNYHFP